MSATAISGTGDSFGLSFGYVVVPSTYSSNDPIGFVSSTYSGDLDSLGIDTGTHEWSWGASADQSITLTAVPEPSSFAFLGLVGVVFAGWKKRKQFYLAF